MNWEVILWSSITFGFLLCIAGIMLTFIATKNIRHRKKDLENVHLSLHVGSNILFGGGLVGKIVAIQGDIIEVEISKGVVVKASRYSIQNINS